jgi:L-fuculokinase
MMTAKPVILIFDVGKTNKKWFLFDEQYQVVAEHSVQLPQSCDEDGFACESIELLTDWVRGSLSQAMATPEVNIKAINFSAYGASLVYVNGQGRPIAPLYSYLKPFPQDLSDKFYARYGGPEDFCKQTASPALGSLNSGLQLLRIKVQRPDLWKNTRFALHLPQYLSMLITGKAYSDITSIGSHTAMWSFDQQRYHRWITEEQVASQLAPIFPSDRGIQVSGRKGVPPVVSGVGLHDSSAALVPYIYFFKEPFLLLSTGTWSITLNPFNQEPLTTAELQSDCLCYLHYGGLPVKASRLHAGLAHELETKRIAAYFQLAEDFYSAVSPNGQLVKQLRENGNPGTSKPPAFSHREISEFADAPTAYHALILDLIAQQVHATSLVMGKQGAKTIFVDGGFSQNALYMQLLAQAFPHVQVQAAALAQASAIGAAMAIHNDWNGRPSPDQPMRLNSYSSLALE